MRNFNQLADQQFKAGKLLCVGLDADVERLPVSLLAVSDTEDPVLHPQYLFNKAIVDATCQYAGFYKPNLAFYLINGWRGVRALEMTVQYINEAAPEVPVILDCKLGDIGNSSQNYADAVYNTINADAMTAHNYIGQDGCQPFIDRPEKTVFFMCRNSNPGSREFQAQTLKNGKMLWQTVAETIRDDWNANRNCGLVVGATSPEDLAAVRALVRDMPILAPGIGAQGGDLEATVKAGVTGQKGGLIINNARQIIFASSGEDFAEAAAKAAQITDEKIRQTLEKL